MATSEERSLTDEEMDAYAESQLERVQQALKLEFQTRRGSVGRVTEALGVGEDYFRQSRHKKRDLGLKLLFRSLAQLKIDPLLFFLKALGPVDDELEKAEQPEGPPSEAVRRIAGRLLDE